MEHRYSDGRYIKSLFNDHFTSFTRTHDHRFDEISNRDYEALLMRSFSHCAPCVACRMFNIRVVGFLLIGIVTLYLLLNSCSQAIKNDVNSPGNPIEKNSSHRIVRRFGRPRRGLRLIKEIEKKFETKYIKNMMTLNTSVLSPLGAFIPVFVLSYGAQGRTRSKFIKALQINGQKTSLAKQGFRRWLEILANHNLRIATKIYYPASYLRPRLSFKDMASFYLHTVMQSIDLDDGHIPSEKINKWLSRKANNRPDVALFEPDHDSENGEIAPIKPLGSDPVMLLVSVVYFKGIWETRFSQTFLRPFTKLNGKQVDTPTMYNYGDYEYGELPELESRFVKIPFHGTSASGSTSMFVILPNALSTYQDLCSRLEQINVKDLYHKGTMAKVDLYLPKFRLESNISLDEWLPTLIWRGIIHKQKKR
ncbi:serine protease inhibitor 3/4-like isoform X2 [Venturia canescens]|uniref:serine protease inhibitor 3/4-like isoform X2 n=1 Tax=Venturia canescens TaxID=32260 RepID=UPI001C9C6DDE|nr:serine protease inhibitor 3/4-like isoform X2 [Venturia canescens]